MKRFFFSSLTIVALGLGLAFVGPHLVRAAQDGKPVYNWELGTLITSQPLDGGSLTASLTRTEPFNHVSLYVKYEMTDGGASAVTMQCAEKYDSSDSTLYWIDLCDGSTYPTLTCAKGTRSHAVSADDAWPWHVPVSGYGLSCTFAATGDPTDDVLTVKARGIVR